MRSHFIPTREISAQAFAAPGVIITFSNNGVVQEAAIQNDLVPKECSLDLINSVVDCLKKNPASQVVLLPRLEKYLTFKKHLISNDFLRHSCNSVMCGLGIVWVSQMFWNIMNLMTSESESEFRSGVGMDCCNNSPLYAVGVILYMLVMPYVSLVLLMNGLHTLSEEARKAVEAINSKSSFTELEKELSSLLYIVYRVDKERNRFNDIQQASHAATTASSHFFPMPTTSQHERDTEVANTSDQKINFSRD